MRVVIATVIALLGALLVPTATASARPPECPYVNGKWSEPGSFPVTSEQSGVGHTVLRAVNLRTCSHPVLLWGNDTGATPENYRPLLEHFASHGFIVVAANTTQSSSGQEMLAGLNWLSQQVGKPGSPYSGGYVDWSHVAAVGTGRAASAPSRRLLLRPRDHGRTDPTGPWRGHHQATRVAVHSGRAQRHRRAAGSGPAAIPAGRGPPCGVRRTGRCRPSDPRGRRWRLPRTDHRVAPLAHGGQPTGARRVRRPELWPVHLRGARSDNTAMAPLLGAATTSFAEVGSAAAAAVLFLNEAWRLYELRCTAP